MSEGNGLTDELGARLVEIGAALMKRIGRETQQLAADAGGEIADLFDGVLREINSDLEREDEE